MSKLEHVLSQLKNVQRSGSGYTARCPSHDDRKNSLSVSEDPNGKPLFFCHAGCSFEQVIATLNIPANGNGHSQQKQIEATYEYTDEEGNLLFECVRYKQKDFRQRRPDRQGGWIYNLDGVRRVLYHLPEVLAAPMVYLVEGEKDVETLRRNDLPATCNPMGAGKWRDEYIESLRGRTVVILPDNDHAGRNHAEKVAASLYGVAEEIVVINLPNLPEKGDVTDYFENGGSVDELMDLVGRAEAWKPTENSNQTDVKNDDDIALALPVLSPKALYGLAGEVVRTIEPHTEADNAALLIQLLGGFGCMIGKTAYFLAEADYHYTKLFAVLVGASSKGRKGTSFGQIRRLLCRVDESFANCIQDGLSSGEGLIYHVRDEQFKKVPVKERGKIVDYQEEIVDEGAKDKRAFVVEPEFARVLRVIAREGNTLSSVIRQAWDSDCLRIRTKNPIEASEVHISMVGHITKDELLRNLDETETANGFANRFLWVFTRRSKYLPEGGNLQDSQINYLVEKLNKAVSYARITKELKRDEQARQKWNEIYQKLSDGHTGLLGSVTSRAEAQVMRLACLYALLDGAEIIQIEHLEAALALWQYCEDSARYIFGNQTGNKTAEAIYAALLGAEEGLTNTQIRDLFQRNASANQINTALKILNELGRIQVSKQVTGGRPQEIFTASTYDKNDINDKSIDIPP